MFDPCFIRGSMISIAAVPRPFSSAAVKFAATMGTVYRTQRIKEEFECLDRIYA